MAHKAHRTWYHGALWTAIGDTFMTSHRCRSRQIFGVWRIFAQISPSLPEKFLCDFFLQIFSHKDHEDLFCGDHTKNLFLSVTSKTYKKGFHVFLVWERKSNVGRHFCSDFQGCCPDFWQIKTFGVLLHPLRPACCITVPSGLPRSSGYEFLCPSEQVLGEWKSRTY